MSERRDHARYRETVDHPTLFAESARLTIPAGLIGLPEDAPPLEAGMYLGTFDQGRAAVVVIIPMPLDWAATAYERGKALLHTVSGLSGLWRMVRP